MFAVALGIAVGAVFRRLLPAMATTFAVFVSLRFVIAEYVRPHDMTPVSKLIPLLGFSAGTGVPAGAWAMPGKTTHHRAQRSELRQRRPGRLHARSLPQRPE